MDEKENFEKDKCGSAVGELTSLTIGKNAHIIAIQCRLYQRRD